MINLLSEFFTCEELVQLITFSIVPSSLLAVILYIIEVVKKDDSNDS